MAEIDWARCEREVRDSAEELAASGRHVLASSGELGQALSRAVAAVRDLADELAVAARRAEEN